MEQDILELAREAEKKAKESPEEARRLFLKAAEKALQFATKLSSKEEKKKWLEQALFWKRQADSLRDGEKFRDEGEGEEDPWGLLEKREWDRARKAFLEKAKEHLLRAQRSSIREEKEDHFFWAQGSRCIAKSLGEKFRSQREVQEWWEEERLAQLAWEEGEKGEEKEHCLLGAEKLLQLPSDVRADWMSERALSLKKRAEALGRGKPQRSVSSSSSQPMRAEFLLKRIEEYERRGLNAREEGNQKKAAFFFGKAAEYLEELIPLSSGRLREAREEKLKKLRELALEGEEEKGKRKQPEKEGGGSGKRLFIPVEKPKIRFDDIAGLEQVKEEVRRKMVLPFRYPELAEKYGVKRGGGILLYGPPGTGKTMIAQAIACEIDAAFFTVRPSEILSKWVGEAEKNLHSLFETARSYERSIIFIDEIEALVPQRRTTSSNVMQRLVPQILAELEGFGTGEKNPLLFLGATNEPWSLDPAVLRPGRFDVKIYVGLPDFEAVKKMLELFLKGKPLAEGIDFDFLAAKMVEKRFSGADIKNICLRAATDAFVKAAEKGVEEEITFEQLLRLVEETKPSVSEKDLQRFEEYREEQG